MGLLLLFEGFLFDYEFLFDLEILADFFEILLHQMFLMGDHLDALGKQVILDVFGEGLDMAGQEVVVRSDRPVDHTLLDFNRRRTLPSFGLLPFTVRYRLDVTCRDLFSLLFSHHPTELLHFLDLSCIVYLIIKVSFDVLQKR